MLDTTKRKTELEIVLETVNYYRANPRAIVDGMPRYIAPDGAMCAIGRCLGTKSVKKLKNVTTKITPLVLNVIKYERKDEWFKPEYRGHMLTFWAKLQELHDNDEYWHDGDLTKEGYYFATLFAD